MLWLVACSQALVELQVWQCHLLAVWPLEATWAVEIELRVTSAQPLPSSSPGLLNAIMTDGSYEHENDL